MFDPNDDAALLAELHQTISLERQALELLEEQLDASWLAALRLLYECKGRIAVSGIGKSGIIARKIVATLSSTGSPAFFLHPAEALHGDLGMVTKNDVVLALSKSGESEEVNAMLTALRRIGAKIISMTTNLNSSMAHVSDIILMQGDAHEACPLNLAPTSSTTVSLVAGDALAVALMRMKNFNQEDFALRHPGGRLGKRLLLMVQDIMLCGDENPVADQNTSLTELLSLLAEKQAGALSLVDAQGKLVGLLTDYDLRKILQSGKNPLDFSPEQLMNKNPIVIKNTEKAFSALCLMQGRTKPITVLPVVDEQNNAVGMLRLHDLVGAGL